MDFKKYEIKLADEVAKVFETIIENNTHLNIRARSRAGAEISDFLEDKFVELVNRNKLNFLSAAEKSPVGATKNPFDAKSFFSFLKRKELIWVDIKAFKISSADSNPDIGTINKVLKFIKEGNFYIVFALVYYEGDERGLKFIKKDGKFTKVYLLKDVNATVRLNPKNQLQVNVSAQPQYRTRKEFIDLLKQKQCECHKRMIKKSTETIKGIDDIYIKLHKINENSERD